MTKMPPNGDLFSERTFEGDPPDMPSTALDSLGPTKLEKAFAACTALHFGATVPEAASEAGVSDKTIRRWREADWWPALTEVVQEDAMAHLEAKARGVLLRKLEDGDGVSARWLLERRQREFAPAAQRVQVEGDVNHRHEARELRQIPTAVIERFADADDDAIDAYFEEARPFKQLDTDTE